MSDNERFKTTLMGGYDKDDVLEQMKRMKDEHAGEVGRLAREIQQKNAKIEELLQRVRVKEEQKEQLELDIKNKYQKYIDHYDSISRLVVEAQIRSENIINEAKAKGERIIAQAEAEAARRVDSVQQEVDLRLEEGKRKYIAVQEELKGIVELMNQVQKRCLDSYKEVHQIINGMPESFSEEIQEGKPELEATGVNVELPSEQSIIEMAEKSLRDIERKVRKDLELEEVLDEEDDLTEEDIERFLKKHGITN